MASLVKTRSGIFYLVLSVNGRRVWRSTGARTREEAEAVIREQYPEHLHTRSPGKLSDFLPQYIEYAEVNLAPSTVLLYRDSVRSLLRILGDKKLERYTAHDIERFKIVRAREVRPVRVNLEMRHLKSFYQTAVRWGMLAQNPFAGGKEIHDERDSVMETPIVRHFRPSEFKKFTSDDVALLICKADPYLDSLIQKTSPESSPSEMKPS